ncbi:MAG: sigma-70 family RNA polymerase sigma factor [Ferruginibacter sp.]
MNKQHYHDIEDKELMNRFYNDGNNEWLGIVLQRYTLLIFGVCMKYLKNEEAAKDAVQQVFLKVINELQKYKVEYFKSWLYMVAKNHCLMQLRDKGKYTAEINDNLLSTMPDEDAKNEAVEKDYTLQQMEKAMLQLNEEQQLCVTLFYLEKKSYQEVAIQTGFNIMQVKSHIQNGKRNLKIQMLKMQHEK